MKLIKMERKQQDTQRIIVSQSMLKFVQDYSKQINRPLKLKEMVRITNVLVDYCIYGNSKEINDTLDKVDDYLNKVDDYLQKVFDNE